MANFNISGCKYIKTVKDPAQYYMKMMKIFIGHSVGDDEVDNEYNSALNHLSKQLQADGQSINSTKALHKVCYYTFAQVWIDACLDTPRIPGKPFTLEYIATDEDGEEYIPQNGFYKKILNRVKNFIYDPAIQTLLSKPDTFGNYPVIDMEKLGSLINGAINEYYNQAAETDERLLRSRIPTKALHSNVEQAIKSFERQIKAIVNNFDPKQNYRF